MLDTTPLVETLQIQGPVWLLLCLIVVAFSWWWTTQFIQLMLMSESDFPGRSDKSIWAAAFVLVFFLAPFAFFVWKIVYLNQLDDDVARFEAANEQILFNKQSLQSQPSQKSASA